MNTECLIIGATPAGFAAAFSLVRAKRKVILLQKGSPRELSAEDWLNNLRKEVEANGIVAVDEEVLQATLGATEKKITTTSEKVWEAPVILLASGCYDRHGFIEGEEQFVGHGIFYNAYQDGQKFEAKTVLVEGKNEQAIREVLYLSRFANKIYFVVPAMKLEADPKLLDRLQKEPKVEIFLSASLKKIIGEERPEAAIVLCAGEEKNLAVDGVFLYARQSHPSYEFLKGTVEISAEGCVLVDEAFMTSIPGVFACGDMIAGIPQLPFVSAAQGMVAAMHADRYLSNLI